jgi:transposase
MLASLNITGGLKVFSISLELPEFKGVKQVFHQEFFHLYVVKKTTEERYPFCGYMTDHVHDWRTRKVRDLKVLEKPLYLFVRVNRFRCFNCHEVFTQTFDSIQPNKHQTSRYRDYLYEQCLGSSIKSVSEKETVPYTTLERIFYSIAQKKEAEQLDELEQTLGEEDLVLSLDEIAVRKGHRYETVLMDAKTGRVLSMEQNRSYESTQLLLTKNVLSNTSVQTIVVDMWNPFHKAIHAVFPAACVVVDKYHVVQKVTQALPSEKEVSSSQKGTVRFIKRI